MTRLEYMCDVIDQADGLADDELATVALLLTQMAQRRRVTRTVDAARATARAHKADHVVYDANGYRVEGVTR